MDLGIAGKTAIVTGGARGLGRVIAGGLAAEGARVAVNYRSEASAPYAEELVQQLTAKYAVPALCVRADVSQEADVALLFDRVARTLGTATILVNNAAVCPTCQVIDTSVVQWEETVRNNVTGTFLMCREFLNRLEQSLGAEQADCEQECPRAQIVNVTSVAAFLGSTSGHAPYDASKGAITSFTTSLAREVAGRGIIVNAVAPGMIRTDMTAAALEANEAKYLARIPLRRIATADEIADVVVFMASTRARYITGTTVNVSGGLLMR